MKILADRHRPFGNTGLRVPPIMFGTNALGSMRRVIPEQTKLEIFGAWFQHVAPPVFIDARGPTGDRVAIQVLARALRRLDVSPEDAVISTRVGWKDKRIGYDAVLDSWAETCRLLGGNHPPKLLSLDAPDEYLAAASSPAGRDQRFQDILEACRALDELKASGQVAGIGAAATDWHLFREIDSAVRLDWLMLVGGFSIMRHPPELFKYMASLAARQIPIVSAGIFDCDFLVGGSCFNGRAVNPETSEDRSLFAWRKAFAALCHGHGISPAQACIQFTLSAPGIVAVAINTSQPDRIAENVCSTIAEVPDAFWASMKEEGLLAPEDPFLE
jgi:D-threo-aldose 1-dehydrogenase